MASRGLIWALIHGKALVRRAGRGARSVPVDPRRIVIVHHLLLGDTILLTPLVAKLRARYPKATLTMACPRAYAPLYSSEPFGLRALPFDLRDLHSARALLSESPFDLALVPGDNRLSWLAQAMGARWIRAFDGDRPAYKSWPVDAFAKYSATPQTLGDMMAALCDGEAAPPFRYTDWPAPTCAPFERPASPYCVLHVGARSPLRQWPGDRWQALAQSLQQRGLNVVLSTGRGEEGLVAAIDPRSRLRSYAGTLDLAQLWHLLAGAHLLVCPDTGIAHLAKITDTPAVVLFGPGSAVMFDKGTYWKNARFHPVTIAEFPCRDQRNLFKRDIPWMRHCARSTTECTAARCVDALDVAMVQAAVDKALSQPRH